MSQQISIALRGYIFSEESAFKIGTNYLRDQTKINTSEFFSSYGVRECYESLLERKLINDDELLRKIVNNL